MEESRILTVFTGGTIGSAPEAGKLRPAGESARKLLLTHFAEKRQKLFEEYFRQRIVFDTVCPYEILSENLEGSHLERLEGCIREKGAADYKGVIVTTGTDTLAYSSGALGYALANLQIPVVVVSANYPLSDERSNGFSNFEGALLLILSGRHKGVFCSYDNGDGHFIHYATRLLPQMNYSHRVESVMGRVYGRVNGMTIEVAERNPEEAVFPGLSCKNLSKKHPVFIRPYPGVVYAVPKDCCGILLDTYHSGTLPVAGEGFRDFMKEAGKRNIPVFAAGVPEGMVYETVGQMKEAGVMVLPPASPAAMYMKLWMAARTGADLRELMFCPMGHDFCAL